MVSDDREWESWVRQRERGSPRPGSGQRPTFADCAAVYRQLKLCFQHSGDYLRAGEFFLREMHCLWKQKKADGDCRWIGGAALEYLCGFGEKPWWTLGWIAAVIVVFAFIHAGCGISGGPDGVALAGKALYFSVVTFTTLGYGDVQPTTGDGMFWCGTEALLGMILMSLFLVCIVRKFSR